MAEQNLLIIGAIFLPFMGAIIGLLLQSNQRERYLGLIVGGGATLCSFLVLLAALEEGPQVYRMGNWLPPFGIVMVGDKLSALFAFMASLVMFSGLLYTVDCKDKSINQNTFIPLFLCMMTGLNGAFYTGDLFSLFVFVELLVLSSVSLVAISDNRFGLEAALKYIFISGMGSLFLLIGVSSLYATYGTLNMADLAQHLASGDRPLLAHAAAIMLTSAFLLKSAVFPFHYWQPDFHTTAPTPISAMLSSVVVKIGIYGMIRMTTLLFIAESSTIRGWLLLLGVISIYFGSLGALQTYNGKRMLAYSTFGQIGFILVAIGWGNDLALVAAVVYAFNHALIKSALLMLMGYVASNNQKKSADLDEIVGFGKGLPAYASVLYLMGGMALAGLPPMNGFISKYLLVRGGARAEDWLVLGLAVGAGLITILYMLRTWQAIFQQAPTPDTVKPKKGGDSILAPALLLSLSLLLGIYATPLYETAEKIVAELRQPEVYITQVLAPEQVMEAIQR